MKELLEKSDLLKPPRIGEIVEGIIIAKEEGGVFLDLGAYGTGIIYGKELSEARDELKGIKIGDKIFAKIIDLENEEGYVELSVKEAGEILAWETIKQKKESGETLTIKISGANKGGLLAEIMGIPAFLPVSQLSPEHYPRVEGGDTAKILRELQNFIGKELEVKIFDFSQKEGKLILSEKAKEAEKIKEILKNYNVGDIVEGEITGLTNFGAFIKFSKEGVSPEPVEGLIHISELDWKIIEDPSEVVKVGEKVKAKIIDISNDKISLSLKALKKDPWENLEKKYKKGDIVKGKVTKFNPFGAFVEITPKIQGLIHISEFGTQKRLQETLKIGEKYDFQILLIDPKEHRMTLKLIKE
jgi:small subunit ribosomal protein S1